MSKLINKTRLEQFATKLWDKIKGRYDKAFKNATISPSTGDEKHITFERVNEQDPLKVSLADYARLQDRNKFKQDVSVDDAATKNNVSIGQRTSTVDPSLRSFGARNLSSGLFTDGYVSKFRVYLDSAYQEQQVAIHVWAIKKGDTKSADRTARNKVHDGKRITVDSDNNKKWIDIPINDTFANDTYFIFRTGSSVNVEAISSIAPENAEHVVNLGVNTPPNGENELLAWGDAINDKTAYVEIFGRIGIVDLNKKLKEVEDASGTYVKHSETTSAGGNGQAGKVVKLDGQGKLSESMLPAIALNEFFTTTAQTWDEQAVANLTFQNGDVIFHQASQKRYLCVNKKAPNFNDKFVELNAKDGVVTSVNNETGAVTLSIEESVSAITIKANNTVVGTINAITEDEINTIIQNLS